MKNKFLGWCEYPEHVFPVAMFLFIIIVSIFMYRITTEKIVSTARKYTITCSMVPEVEVRGTSARIVDNHLYIHLYGSGVVGVFPASQCNAVVK